MFVISILYFILYSLVFKPQFYNLLVIVCFYCYPSTHSFTINLFKALNSLYCVDVPLRNYSLCHSLYFWCVVDCSWDTRHCTGLLLRVMSKWFELLLSLEAPLIALTSWFVMHDDCCSVHNQNVYRVPLTL